MIKLWSYIINKNLDRVDDEWDQRNLRIINTLFILLSVIMTLFFALSFVVKIERARYLVIGSLVLCVLHFLFSHKFSLHVIKTYFCIIPLILVSAVSVYIVGAEGNDRYYFLNTLILPLIVFREKKYYFPVVLLNVILFFFVYYLQSIIEPSSKIPQADLGFYLLVNDLAFIVILYILFLSFRREIFGFQQKINTQNVTLEEKNKEITDGINYAKKIQEAILPSQSFVDQAFDKGFIYYLPKDIVAGDFYWIEKEEDTIYFAAADCTGHGVPGAMVSVVCANALNQSLKELGIKSVEKLLDSTADLVIKTFEKADREVKDGMDIAMCSYNSNSKQLTFSGANNPMWIISSKSMLDTASPYGTLDAESGKYLHEIKGSRRPVGKSHNMTPFDLHTVQINEGDRVLLFTDGFADQFGGPNGKKYKYAVLKKFLLGLKDDADISQELSLEFQRWRSNYEQVDDVCFVGFEI